MGELSKSSVPRATSDDVAGLAMPGSPLGGGSGGGDRLGVRAQGKGSGSQVSNAEGPITCPSAEASANVEPGASSRNRP